MSGSCWARLGAAAERRAGGVAHDGEDAARLALPHILLVVRVLRALQTARHTRSPKCTACHARCDTPTGRLGACPSETTQPVLMARHARP